MLNYRKWVHIDGKNGLCNRLEMLMTAYAFAREGGHHVLLDWQDYSLLELPDTRPGKLSLPRRLVRQKVTNNPGDFSQLCRRSTLEIKGLGAVTPELAERELLEYAPRIRPSSMCRAALDACLSKYHGEVVVGVHIRQGDFRAAETNQYEAINGRHTRVPIWWYQHMMQLISRVFPSTVFLLSYSGDRVPLRPLEESFNCEVADYGLKHSPTRVGHQAGNNAVADLFALASCSLILGTPASSFSHWAASNLGPRTLVISPPLVTHREKPRFVISAFRYKSLYRWVNFSWLDQPREVFSSWPDNSPTPRFDTNWW